MLCFKKFRYFATRYSLLSPQNRGSGYYAPHLVQWFLHSRSPITQFNCSNARSPLSPTSTQFTLTLLQSSSTKSALTFSIVHVNPVYSHTYSSVQAGLYSRSSVNRFNTLHTHPYHPAQPSPHSYSTIHLNPVYVRLPPHLVQSILHSRSVPVSSIQSTLTYLSFSSTRFTLLPYNPAQLSLRWHSSLSSSIRATLTLPHPSSSTQFTLALPSIQRKLVYTHFPILSSQTQSTLAFHVI